MTDRTLTFTDSGWEDYLYWQGQDNKTLRRINELIKATLRSPFEGIGKPEAGVLRSGPRRLGKPRKRAFPSFLCLVESIGLGQNFGL